MIHINRSQPLEMFTDYVKHFNPTNWDNFVTQHNDLYKDIRLQLEADQFYLSGYTELPLSKGTHIDHFLKKDMFPQNVFDWQNYVVDDHNNNYGADYKDRHVHTRVDNEKLISPINEYPQHFFTYQVSGKIIARDNLKNEEKERAKYSIDNFNLNHNLLVKKRLAMLRLIDSYQKGGLDKGDIITALKDFGLTSFIDYCLNVLSN